MDHRVDHKISAAEALARYLGTRMRTTAEARQHLRDKDYNESEIDAVVDDCVRKGYLDDADYVRAYCDYAYAKGRARRRIQRELAQRGIPAETIENGMEDYIYEHSVDERAAASAAAQRMAEDIGTPLEPRHIARVARRLDALGYSSSTIHDVLEEIKE